MGVSGETGQLLLEFSGVALRTFGLLIPKNNRFEFVAAFRAKILKYRHYDSVAPALERLPPAIMEGAGTDFFIIDATERAKEHDRQRRQRGPVRGFRTELQRQTHD